MLFYFAFKDTPHAMKHRVKGLEPRRKGGDGERESKAATKNLSPAADVGGDVWSCCCSVCALLLPAWQLLPVLQEKEVKTTHRNNADPLSNTRGFMVRIWGEWDKPCDSFDTEIILFLRTSQLEGAFCTDFRHLPYPNGQETDLYGQRSRKPQMRGKNYIHLFNI